MYNLIQFFSADCMSGIVGSLSGLSSQLCVCECVQNPMCKYCHIGLCSLEFDIAAIFVSGWRTVMRERHVACMEEKRFLNLGMEVCPRKT